MPPQARHLPLIFCVTLAGHFPDLPKADAQELLEAAHRVCPYSVATRGNVDVTLEVV